jgi:hypothetical protein
LAEAFKTYPNADVYFILSIGNGRNRPTGVESLSAFAWIRKISDIFMGGAASMVPYTLNNFIPMFNKKVCYVRVQVNLPVENLEMSNISQENINTLIQKAEDTLRDPECPLHALTEVLKEINKTDASEFGPPKLRDVFEDDISVLNYLYDAEKQTI